MPTPLPFPISLAELVGLFMESILYGVFLVSFVACVKVLAFGGRKLITFSDRMILGVVLAMGVIATLDIALFFRRIIEAFVNFTGKGGPPAVFGDLAHWSTVMRGFIYGLQTLLGDSILIYRCWKVYFHNWLLIAFPILMWFGVMVCVIAACVIESQLVVGSSLTGKDLAPWGTGFISLTFSLNIIVTAMIAWRIHVTYSNSVVTGASDRGSGLRHVMFTIIESGAIYSMSMLTLLAVYVSKSNANVPMSDAMVQIIPIVFNVVLLRVYQGRSSGNATQNTSKTANTIVFTQKNPQGSATKVGSSPGNPMRFKNRAENGAEESFSMDTIHAKSHPTYNDSLV